MRNKMRSYILFAGLCCTAFACRKFNSLPNIDRPAYIRVFNDLSYQPSLFNQNLANPYLTMLIDPQMDAAGVPFNAAVIGDFLDTRLPFSPSYPDKAGNTGIINTNEYPGSRHVQTAPPINGFDLSGWAQTGSGKHRFLFMSRPFTDTPFVRLPASARSVVIADTTVDLAPEEVYTLEVVLQDDAKPTYTVYIRKEKFTGQPFSDQQVYVNFYNLSANFDPYSGQLQSNRYWDTLKVFCTAHKSDCHYTSSSLNYSCNFEPAPNFNNVYFTTLVKRFETEAPYFPIAPFSREDYLYPNGVFKQAVDQPYLEIRFYTPGSDPAQHTYNFRTTNLPYLITNADGLMRPYATINSVELINDKVYTLQIQRKF